MEFIKKLELICWIKKFKKVVKKQIYPFNDTKACDRVYDVLREI